MSYPARAEGLVNMIIQKQKIFINAGAQTAVHQIYTAFKFDLKHNPILPTVHLLLDHHLSIYLSIYLLFFCIKIIFKYVPVLGVILYLVMRPRFLSFENCGVHHYTVHFSSLVVGSVMVPYMGQIDLFEIYFFILNVKILLLCVNKWRLLDWHLNWVQTI